ncbi:tetratricopeptide repeat protein [Rhodohalobacter halophilus]|uniref:tetratricopeptide repeat protein n=1 Tax=Rhodohalobacter halophilus TaxID=1812810 RepID=UPI00083F6096|nr:tetratricopeptide repeat protein [Rhodohalobacter halophilus]
MSKRLKNEDLEQDLLIEYSSRFVHFYNQNKAAVLGGGISFVLVIGLLIGYFYYSAQQEQRAQNLLSIAEQALFQGDFQTALHGDDEEFTLGFAQIANNFSRTDAGNLAKYYAAVSEYELGNFESSLSYIESFSKPRGILGVPPSVFHATLLLEMERFEDAASLFEQAAGWDENNATTPANLYQAAQAYDAAGLTTEANRVLDQILRDYPNSQVIARAERMKGALAVRG